MCCADRDGNLNEVIIMTWYPGWNSLESVKFWHIFWEISGIVILGLLVAAEVLAFQYSHRKDYLSESAESTRIEEQQRKDAENETRRAAEVGQLQKQLADADKKVAGLQTQNIARRLTTAQKEALVTSLTPFAGQKLNIWCLTAAWDCVDFATDFQGVFRQAKWQVPDQIAYGIVVGGDAVGIEVLVNPQIADPNGQVSMPSAVTLVMKLASMNLMAPHLGRMPEIAPDTIFFRIGRIPPP
jgi:hypothetical protein